MVVNHFEPLSSVLTSSADDGEAAIEARGMMRSLRNSRTIGICEER